MDRRSLYQFVANVVGVGIPLLALTVLVGHTDLATDGSQLAVSILRASFDAGGRLDVTDGGWHFIVGLAAVAMVALVDDMGVTHHSKVLHDHTDADALTSDDRCCRQRRRNALRWLRADQAAQLRPCRVRCWTVAARLRLRRVDSG